jgi:glycosyltransferase involved in cell wall biosynthesis
VRSRTQSPNLSRVAEPALSFDLVVATTGRSDELEGLLASLERQTQRTFRLLVVDQNADDRVVDVLARHRALEIAHLRSQPGLSRARNVALGELSADLVAFPDDDCVYPDDLLERVARRFAEEPGLDVLSGRAEDASGAASERWPADAALLTPDTVWNRANSHTLFLRRSTVERVGRFDEALGLGSGTPWHSGEEIDFLVRALRRGATGRYDPSFVVVHPRHARSAAELRALGARDGGSVGYILAKNGYPAGAVTRMLLRPLAGAALAVAGADLDRARFHLATLGGRMRGYRAGSAARAHA